MYYTRCKYFKTCYYRLSMNGCYENCTSFVNDELRHDERVIYCRDCKRHRTRKCPFSELKQIPEDDFYCKRGTLIYE